MRCVKRKLLKLFLLILKTIHGKSYMKIYNEYLRSCGMHICGTIKYIHSSVYIDTAYAHCIHIGDNCVISINSIILAHDFSLECGMNSIGCGDLRNEKKIVRDVYIGNNVFIGAGCVVLPGVHIGNNCIIGAGTVCSGIIPDNSVVVGGKWKIVAKTDEWTKQRLETESNDCSNIRSTEKGGNSAI